MLACFMIIIIAFIIQLPNQEHFLNFSLGFIVFHLASIFNMITFTGVPLFVESFLIHSIRINKFN